MAVETGKKKLVNRTKPGGRTQINGEKTKEKQFCLDSSGPTHGFEVRTLVPCRATLVVQYTLTVSYVTVSVLLASTKL
jgi:hypothetical protein